MLLSDRAPSDCEIMGLADGMSPLLHIQLGDCGRVKQTCLCESCLPSGPSSVLQNQTRKGWDTKGTADDTKSLIP